jgi:hypothetical protein
MLELYHPLVARRDCGHCQKFQYDEETGQPTRDERAVGALGEDDLWYRRSPAPCRLPQGCPKGTPEEPHSLSARNRLAWQHYQECKATGNFPQDAIVSRNAGIIGRLETAYDRQQNELTQKSIRMLANLSMR